MPSSGNSTVTLTVRNAAGCTATARRTITALTNPTFTCNGTTYRIQCANSGTATFANAASRCPSGWRLPTAAQLKCAYQQGRLTTGNGIWYWSSQTTAQATPDCNCTTTGTNYVGLTTFTTNCTTCSCNRCQPYTAGRLYGVFSHNPFYVRCVQ
jgi:PKD repeat protein